MLKKVSLTAMALVICANQAMAGGFSLSEYSTTAFGRGFAGQGVVGDDLSAIIANPAGMTLAKDGIQLGASFIDIYANIDDNKDTSNHDKINIFSPVPSFFAQTSLSDKMKVGVAFYTPYGIGTDYKRNWWGRDEALLSEIVVYDFTVSSSYDLTNKWSVGASLSSQFATANLTNDKSLTPAGEHAFANLTNDKSLTPAGEHALNSDIKGDSDIELAYTLGVMYKVNENNRYGLSYRSKSKYDLTGTHKLTANMNIPAGVLGDSPVPMGYTMKGDAHASVTLPENILLSSYHKIDDRLALSSSVKWTRWSRFKELNIYSDVMGTDALVSSTKENWRDTWTVSLGADYDYTKDWTLRAGVEIEKTPIPSDANRTARIPDDNRLITALGASYKFNGGKVDFGYAHIFTDGGNAQYSSDGSNAQYSSDGSEFNTSYDLHINMLSASVQYYF